MKMNKFLNPITLLLITTLVISFQNCSDVNFSDSSTASEKSGSFEVGDPLDGDNPNGGDDPNNGDDPVVVIPPPVIPEPVWPPGKNKNPNGFNCIEGDVADIVVNIDRIEVGGIAVQGPVGAQSLIQMSEKFIISSNTPTSGSQVRLVLKPEGNYLTNTVGTQFQIKTPSAQQSGWKINFQGQVGMASDQTYVVAFVLNDRFLHKAGKKCILKPVATGTVFNEVEF